ncbi:hypothetical protein BD309DRAFT_854006 [Dichomitus squalens]|uniref:MARVEL domain-containing protein n=1 Tax=Dichomitus squalens TaxID=114155 RepID=A0A4Q9QDX9_9APHY|nr:uncharacterized protein DICSQDRAFT_75463 [Dichomitus squalens LYAD-421 SS1]EJF66609.1 hypothetical protein DICSQDRAFT_75463 [Dichomitus squalens LYAD-421 SS1]TBU35142.1 hypothetical protein BD311DRAFT_205135 [Dichomitus squalens]TBU48381.1 hypothetical protein BD309DRAFT_854006 [Dichomitus squalens]TBU64964.1 hypothetical protein BD310DRAFT_913760 [Dichomitus squalens]
MYWLSIFRIAVLGWTSFCAIVLLGVGAHVLSAVGGLLLPSFPWAGLAVATGVLAFLTVPTMLAIDFIRKGAFTSMIVVELSWLGFLGIMFLASGGAAADTAANYFVSCSTWSPALARTVCSETSAGAAFGFLGWLPLWAYTGTLLVLLIIQANRGNYVWRRSVKESFPASGIPPAATGTYDEGKLQQPVGQYQYPPANSTTSMAGYWPAGGAGAPEPAHPYPQV